GYWDGPLTSSARNEIVSSVPDVLPPPGLSSGLAARSAPAAPSALDADIHGLTYSGGCQLRCCSLPLSLSCIYPAFTASAYVECPRQPVPSRVASSSSKRSQPGSELRARSGLAWHASQPGPIVNSASPSDIACRRRRARNPARAGLIRRGRDPEADQRNFPEYRPVIPAQEPGASMRRAWLARSACAAASDPAGTSSGSHAGCGRGSSNSLPSPGLLWALTSPPWAPAPAPSRGSPRPGPPARPPAPGAARGVAGAGPPPRAGRRG